MLAHFLMFACEFPSFFFMMYIFTQFNFSLCENSLVLAVLSFLFLYHR